MDPKTFQQTTLLVICVLRVNKSVDKPHMCQCKLITYHDGYFSINVVHF